MDLIIEKVSKKQARQLRKLAPSYVLSRVGDFFVHTLVALEQTHNGLMAVGVIQYLIIDEKCHLSWLYVRDEYRGKCIGRQLVLFMRDDASKEGIHELECLVHEGICRSVSPENVSNYLLSVGFDQKEKILGPYCFSGKELIQEFSPGDMGVFDEYANSAVPFSKMTSEDIVKEAAALGITDSKKVLSADKDISCMCIKQGECLGMFAFQKKGNFYTLLFLEAKDEESEMKLFGYTLYNAFRKLKISDYITIKVTGKHTDWIAKTMPELRRKQAILVTKTL